MKSHNYNDDPQLVIVGDYLFDPQEGLLSGPSGVHHMCPRMSALLTALAANPCRVVSREWLMEELWAGESEASKSLTQCVGRLRQYFGDTAKAANYIETAPQKGYRLVAPVYGSNRRVVLPHPGRMVHEHQESRLFALIQDLRERKVYRAMLIYSIVVWLLFQISEIVVPALNMPFWVNSLVVFLGILGFPIAAILSWIFDLTPHGLVREVAIPPSKKEDPGRKRGDLVFDMVLTSAALAICIMLFQSV